MNNDQLDKFLSTATPYHFTIENTCDDLATATINLESINAEAEKQLEDQYINAVLYENDYKVNLNREKKLIERIYNDENKVLENSLHAYSLYNFNLKPDETRDFNLLLYMDQETPMEEENMNASWKGKITLSTEYQEENTTIRTISYNDSKGIWGYKDKLIKIVTENKKSEKQASKNGKVYGPFDESADGYGGVQSYVVCEIDDTNCIGYLQGNGGVKANNNSSNLFYNFTEVTEIDLSNLDTSNITNITNMFYKSKNIKKLNLSNWTFSEKFSNEFTYSSNINDLSSDLELILKNVDTSKVTNMSNMFAHIKVSKLDLNDFDTSHVTDMQNMFYDCQNLLELKIDKWNTNSLENINSMFSSCKSIVNIDLSNFDTFNINNASGIFSGCSSLNSLNLSNWKFNNSMNAIFSSSNVYLLSELILKNVDTTKMTNMVNMFNGCSSLTELDLSSFDTSNVTAMDSMFNGTTNLQHITFGSKFVHKPEATITGMFTGCPLPDRPTGDTWQDVSFDFLNTFYTMI